MIRNSVTVKEGVKLLEKRFQAEELLNAMNGQIRQLEALNGNKTISDYSIPSALMVGVTVPVNGRISKLPLGGVFSKLAPNPGGSVFVGWVIVPQKVQFIMDEEGQLVGPVQYAVPSKEVEPDSYQGKLTSLLTPAPEGSTLNYAARNLRLETRFVVVPSLDIKTGRTGLFKQTGLQPTLGFVFSRGLVRTHQVLNNGPAASVPGGYVRVLKNATGHLGKYALPNWLVSPIERYVDTIKVGTSLSAQNPLQKVNSKSTVQFTENTFVWMRFADARRAKNKVSNTVEGIATGQFRPSWFWFLSPFGDGESENYSNGLMVGGTSMISENLVTSLQGLLADLDTSDETLTAEQRIQLLEQSLQDPGLDDTSRSLVNRALESMRKNLGDSKQ
jgi:hypothetical protein